MKATSSVTAVFCLSFTHLLIAQSALIPSSAVSFYQLSHKPDKEAQRLFKQGLRQLNHRDFRSSLESFQLAVAIDPRYWAAQNDLGYAYLKLAQVENAELAFGRAVEIDPQNPVGHVNKSLAALRRADYELAETFARTALRLNPQFPEAKALLGLAQVGQGKWSAEAHRLLKECYRSIPGAEKLLAEWPANDSERPDILLVTVCPP